MSHLSKVNITAIEYIQHVLNGGRTLSQSIFDRIDLKKGFVGATCKKDLSQLSNFDAGGVCSAKDGLQLMSEFIHQKLIQKNLNCIFVNDSASKGDEVLKRYSNVLYYEDEVYHYLNADISIDNIEKTVRAAETSMNLVGVITSLQINKEFSSKNELNGKNILSIVDGMEYLIVGAFDGECYLIWSKKPIEL
jgi:hypothetical protein